MVKTPVEGESALISLIGSIVLEGHAGFEPAYSPPKGDVLPLHQCPVRPVESSFLVPLG